MSLLMDALRSAETVKRIPQYDEDTKIDESSSQGELPTDYPTPENQLPVEKESSDWEEKLSHVNIQEHELKLEESSTESTIKDWTEALLFDADDDDTPIQLEESKEEEKASPPIIWEEAVLPEFSDDDQNTEEVIQESTAILAEEPNETPSTLSVDKQIENPLILADETQKTPEKLSDDVVNTPVRDDDFTDISIHDDHIEFTDWIDDHIDEDALRTAYATKTQEENEINEELSLLENLAEGNATHPNVAKRLLTARGKSPRLQRSTLGLLGLLGIVLVSLGGVFFYYYYSIESSGISFNKNPNFKPRPLTLSKPLSVDTQQEKIAENSFSYKRVDDKETGMRKQEKSSSISSALKSTESVKTVQNVSSESKQEKESTVVEEGKKDHIIASETKPAHTLKSAPENEVSSKKPEPTQTATGIHTLRKTTETFDNTQLSEAYDAFQRGDIKTAQRVYVQVLKTEPNNRDALLGLAGISLQQGHSEKAQYYYQRVLEFYPQDSHGQVGLVNALAQSAPEYSESQLKSLLKESPEASYIHFSLGNLYARQGRWAQAQQAYFSAYQYDTHHPDYAYNLAVSLDQINQPRLALSYYQKSLQLIKNSQVTYHFSPQATQQRIKTLTTYYQREIK